MAIIDALLLGVTSTEDGKAHQNNITPKFISLKIKLSTHLRNVQ